MFVCMCLCGLLVLKKREHEVKRVGELGEHRLRSRVNMIKIPYMHV